MRPTYVPAGKAWHGRRPPRDASNHISTLFLHAPSIHIVVAARMPGLNGSTHGLGVCCRDSRHGHTARLAVTGLTTPCSSFSPRSARSSYPPTTRPVPRQRSAGQSRPRCRSCGHAEIYFHTAFFVHLSTSTAAQVSTWPRQLVYHGH
jgi:hypothetical protein